MKKALISPEEKVLYISSWVWNTTNWVAVFSELIGAQRIAQVEDTTFSIASPLHWVDCPDNCEAAAWYYDGQSCMEISNVPEPPLPDGVEPNAIS
jgi:hypothetical protein